ncbi:DinB family protein [Mucilaginibacter sp. Bleaf8]|nr:DinB family protein [Mucilaginibacter sp. Bleaf8]
MLKGYYIELADFNNWADSRAMDWISQITDEQWNQVAVSSFGSISKTAIHIVSAKKIWIDLWTNVQDPVYLSSEFTGTREDLIDIWKTTSAKLKSFIEHYPVENYTNEITVKKPNGELSAMEFKKTFPHMINHSTYHRGQLVTLLRQSGFSNLSNTDLFTYYNT